MTRYQAFIDVLEAQKFKLTGNDSYALGKNDMIADIVAIHDRIYGAEPTEEEIEVMTGIIQFAFTHKVGETSDGQVIGAVISHDIAKKIAKAALMTMRWGGRNDAGIAI